jgi:hypothetical protein
MTIFRHAFLSAHARRLRTQEAQRRHAGGDAPAPRPRDRAPHRARTIARSRAPRGPARIRQRHRDAGQRRQRARPPLGGRADWRSALRSSLLRAPQGHRGDHRHCARARHRHEHDDFLALPEPVSSAGPRTPRRRLARAHLGAAARYPTRKLARSRLHASRADGAGPAPRSLPRRRRLDERRGFVRGRQRRSASQVGAIRHTQLLRNARRSPHRGPGLVPPRVRCAGPDCSDGRGRRDDSCTAAPPMRSAASFS